ncbi:MAG: hypothetical protein ACPG2A_03990 [Parvibaculales bacterium]
MLSKIFKTFLLLTAAAFAAPHAWAQASVFNADKVTFCSDGEFDWNSGQSLYDFVILSREDGQFLISYLGIPHPGFEKRFFDNAWIKMKGLFYARKEAGDIFDSLEMEYVLSLDLEGQPKREGRLTIDATGQYKFSLQPPLNVEYVTATGLCWDSLSREPDAIRRKANQRR